MTSHPIKPGTACRLGIRKPPSRLLMLFKTLADEERKANFLAAVRDQTEAIERALRTPSLWARFKAAFRR